MERELVRSPWSSAASLVPQGASRFRSTSISLSHVSECSQDFTSRSETSRLISQGLERGLYRSLCSLDVLNVSKPVLYLSTGIGVDRPQRPMERQPMERQPRSRSVLVYLEEQDRRHSQRASRQPERGKIALHAPRHRFAEESTAGAAMKALTRLPLRSSRDTRARRNHAVSVPVKRRDPWTKALGRSAPNRHAVRPDVSVETNSAPTRDPTEHTRTVAAMGQFHRAYCRVRLDQRGRSLAYRCGRHSPCDEREREPANDCHHSIELAHDHSPYNPFACRRSFPHRIGRGTPPVSGSGYSAIVWRGHRLGRCPGSPRRARNCCSTWIGAAARDECRRRLPDCPGTGTLHIPSDWPASAMILRSFIPIRLGIPSAWPAASDPTSSTSAAVGKAITTISLIVLLLMHGAKVRRTIRQLTLAGMGSASQVCAVRPKEHWGLNPAPSGSGR